jgi:hypothetical protein
MTELPKSQNRKNDFNKKQKVLKNIQNDADCRRGLEYQEIGE